MDLILHYDKNTFKTMYAKNKWRQNIVVVESSDDNTIYIQCDNVSRFDTWATAANESTIDIYFNDGSEITFLKVNNINARTGL